MKQHIKTMFWDLVPVVMLAIVCAFVIVTYIRIALIFWLGF